MVPEPANHEGRVLNPDLMGRLVANATALHDRVAIEDDYSCLSWNELVGAASNTAGSLARAGVRPGDRVVLRLPNSVDFVVAALGCLWLGAPFVPISLEEPADRVDSIVAQCLPVAVIQSDRTARLQGIECFGPGQLLSERHDISEPCRTPHRDAYIIFTSGTTGRAKGVRTSIESFGWAVATTARSMGLGPSTRSLSVSSYNFDGSYATLFTTLWAGGCVLIPPREELLFGKRFFRSVLDRGITHSSFSPTYLRLLLKSPRFGELADSNLSTLALGGEAMSVSDLRGLWDVMPELGIYNIYGPTETTIQVTSFRVPKRFMAAEEVPIGLPHEGVEFHVVGGDGSVGRDAGELYIGGRQLMSGYWGDEVLTEQVLRRDVISGQILYKTGDLVERDGQGLFYYRARLDDVIKRRGVRVSLEEVRRALEAVPEVEAAICLPAEGPGGVEIAAVIQTSLETAVPILRAARSQLPEAMMPDKVRLVRTLPVNSSGKVDRAALTQLEW